MITARIGSQMYIIRDAPWWDFKAHAIEAADGLKDWLLQTAVGIGHAIWSIGGIVLPTVACIGIIWWMCHFFPHSDDWAPKLVGSSLILFMFYVLLTPGG